jgi:hypothetical protein
MCKDAKQTSAECDPLFVSPEGHQHTEQKVTILAGFKKTIVELCRISMAVEFPSLETVTFALKDKWVIGAQVPQL